MKRTYVEDLHLNAANRERLKIINSIIEDYRKQGYKLTLRQLYYQLVSKDIIANKLSEYSRLSTLLTKGRMAGVVDWDAIEDRLRVPNRPSTWDSPQEILDAVAKQYREDRLKDMDTYVEVWVEKDALSGVLKRVTEPYGVYLLVNRGYSSTSAMHDAFMRFSEEWDAGKKVVLIYLGDHDPSGLDMARDIRERLETFRGDSLSDDEFVIDRVALTSKQIKQYNPPPNPAKMTDPRANEYVSQFGNTSWEVDALPPNALHKLLENAIVENIDMDKFQEIKAKEAEVRAKLKEIAENWEDNQ